MRKDLTQVRTCIVCGAKKQKFKLNRYIWRIDTPIYDEQQQEPGRGAYCCQFDPCRNGIWRMQKKWARIFRLQTKRMEKPLFDRL